MAQTVRQKALLSFVWTILFTAAGLLAWILWSLLWPFDPVEVNEGSYVVMNEGKRVARGETLLVYVDYCKKLNVRAQLDTMIEQDGRLMLLMPQYSERPFGCHKLTIAIATIPANSQIETTTASGSGRARLRLNYRYRINQIREVEQSFVTDEFIITP